MIASNDFLARIWAYWGRRFGCETGFFESEATLVCLDEELKGTSLVSIYHLQRCSVLRMDVSLGEKLQLAHQQVLPSIFRQKDLQALIRLGMRHIYHVERIDSGSYQYLDAIDHKVFVSTAGKLVEIKPEQDWGLIEGLCQSCSSQDVEEAEISQEQPDAVVFGHLVDGRLVSYAGYRLWEGLFADIGVLTNPNFRRMGLSRVATGRLCAWCVEHELIPMYRVSDDNLASQKIPAALGFKKLVDVEALQVTSQALGV